MTPRILLFAAECVQAFAMAFAAFFLFGFALSLIVTACWMANLLP